MKKTILIIILIIFILALIGFAFYWFYLKPATLIEQTEEGAGSIPIGGLPTVSPGELTPSPAAATPIIEKKLLLKTLASKDILAFWQSGTSSLQYLTKDGLFEIDYSLSDIKEQKKELGVNFANILSIEPSVKGKILIKYVAQGATKPSYSILDVQTQELKNLDVYIKNATWSPDGENLIYYYSDSPLYYQENFKESSYLAQLDKNLSNRKVLMNFKVASDVLLSWPTTTSVYISQKPSGLTETTVLVLNMKNKTFQPFVSGYGLILKWDNLGQYGLLFTTQSGGINPKLQLINKDGYILADFPNVALPEKCVFAHSKPILFCGIFVNSSFSGVWPDVYYMGTVDFVEALYAINLETMEAQLLNDRNFKIKDIQISKDNQKLFFYDEKENTLFALDVSEFFEKPQTTITLTPSPTGFR